MLLIQQARERPFLRLVRSQLASLQRAESSYVDAGNDTMRDPNQKASDADFLASVKVHRSFHHIQTVMTPSFSRGEYAVWQEELDSLSMEASYLLEIAALLDPDDFPDDLLSVHVASVAVQDGVNLAKDIYRNVIRELRRLGLLENDASKNVLSRLVQEAMRRQWTNGQMQLIFDRAATCLSKAFPRQIKGQSMFKDWKACSRITSHLLHLARHYEFFQPALKRSLEFADLLGHCGWYLWERGEVDMAFTILMIAKRTCESHVAEGPPAIAAFIYSNLSAVYNTRGMRVEAAEMSRLVVNMREAYLEPHDQDLATAYSNYAADLNALDNIEEPMIENYYQKALKIRASPMNAENDLELYGQTLSNAGRYWARLHKYPEAEEALQKAIELRSRALGTSSPTTAISIYGLANVKLAQGHLDEAIELHQQCLDIRKSLDPTSFWTGVSYHKMATLVYQKYCISSATRALELVEEAVAIFRNAQAEPGLLARSLYKRSQLRTCIANAGQHQSQLEKCSKRVEASVFAQEEPPIVSSTENPDRLVQFDHR